MWKFLSRGVREAVERNLNIGRSAEARVKKDKSQVNCCQRIAPFVNERQKYFGSTRTEHGSQRQEGPSDCNFRDGWFGAFSCSGALVLGWMLSQPTLWRKWCGLPDKRRAVCDYRRIRLFDLIQSTAWTQPLSTPAIAGTLSLCNDTPDGPFFGPQTAKEALDEAADEFRVVHNSMLAEIENKRGVDLINRKKSREALELFISASHRGYGPAAYNLAQCFELGIGIKQNFHEAAKWYQTAVERGHLTAMYNLGVFYVHGWGGLLPDTAKARRLFEEAANLGQPDAKAALGIKETPIPSVPCESVKRDSWNDNGDEFSSNRLTDVSNNADEIFRLASSFETSVDPDPITAQLMAELYRIASDMGHVEAGARAQVLQTFCNVPDKPFDEDFSGRLEVFNC